MLHRHTRFGKGNTVTCKGRRRVTGYFGVSELRDGVTQLISVAYLPPPAPNEGSDQFMLPGK